MSEDQYLTISSLSEGLYKEKGSKFLSFALPVSTHEDVKNTLTEFKKNYYDARHVCYAYSLGFPQTEYMGSDGGEPAHTAGDPILGQIRSKELVNVMVLVVRYFGGTKLGASGLINAYKTAAFDALENATTIMQLDTIAVLIEFSYPQMNQVMKLIKDYDLVITAQAFELECTLEVAIRKTLVDQVKKALAEGQIEFKAL